MVVKYAHLNDFEQWLALAREVEPLFGPMIKDDGFKSALMDAISNQTALCISSAEGSALAGGIIISKDLNEIMWLAVSEADRGKGFGRQLVASALNALDTTRDIVVQTFDRTVKEGQAARKLYAVFGFIDDQDGGLNPAGIPTVIMKRPGAKPTATKSSNAHRLR